LRARAVNAAPAVLGTLVVLAGVWLYTANSGSIYVRSLPTMLKDFWNTWFFADFSSDLLPSVEHVVLGLLIAIVVGVALGIAFGLSRTLRLMTQPVVSFLRSIPVPALVAPAVIAFGIGGGTRIGIVAFGCVWPILLNTMDGVAELHQTVRDTARAYRITGLRRLFYVTLPSVGPRIASACRISVVIALLAMVISETVAASNGIGFQLVESVNNFAIDTMWACIVAIGALGILLNGALTLVERNRLGWYIESQKGAE
jgi:ABC-type nitrate/sulfonate/bicarbonate transport system permease component